MPECIKAKNFNACLVQYQNSIIPDKDGGEIPTGTLHLISKKYNSMPFPRDTMTPKIHPTQKPIQVLEKLIELFTDKGDVVIDPCAGSGSTLIASENLGRKSYGFEIKKEFFHKFQETMSKAIEPRLL